MTTDGRGDGQWEDRHVGVGERRLVGGRYELRERLAAGGMGAVWTAYDVVMRREVALKEMHLPYLFGRPRDPAARASAVERMRREARAAGRVDHPSVVTIHDVIVHDEHPWIVMELVRGETLADRLDREGSLPEAEAARIALDVLEGLDAAHARGVLHRDVKPANVLLGAADRVVLTDFGIARIEGETSLTVTGEFFGSLRYCAPERMGGREPGPESDLWSLGVVLYEAVEGVSPFERPTMEATVAAVLAGAPQELPRAPGLAGLVRGLLAMEPEDRPTVEETRAALRAVVAGRAESGPGAGAVGEAVPGSVGDAFPGPVGDAFPEGPGAAFPEGDDVPDALPDAAADVPGAAPEPLLRDAAPPGGGRPSGDGAELPASASPSGPSGSAPPGRSLTAFHRARARLAAVRVRGRSRVALVCAAGAGALVIAGAGWLLAGPFGNGQRPGPHHSKSPAPTRVWTKGLRSYDESRLGYRIAVPSGFHRQSEPDRVTYTDAHDPQVWIEVYRDNDPPSDVSRARDWARREVEWLAKGRQGDGEDGERLAVRADAGTFASTRHRGEPAVEYTGRLRSVNEDGELSRRVVQRNLVVRDGEGGMYQLRVSVPESEDGRLNGGGLFQAATSRFTQPSV
jgi:hypothetical protein